MLDCFLSLKIFYSIFSNNIYNFTFEMMSMRNIEQTAQEDFLGLSYLAHHPLFPSFILSQTTFKVTGGLL